MRVSKFTDFVKQIDGIGVIDPVVSKYDLIFVLSNRYRPTPSLSFWHFFENLKIFQVLPGQIISQICLCMTLLHSHKLFWIGVSGASYQPAYTTYTYPKQLEHLNYNMTSNGEKLTGGIYE